MTRDFLIARPREAERPELGPCSGIGLGWDIGLFWAIQPLLVPSEMALGGPSDCSIDLALPVYPPMWTGRGFERLARLNAFARLELGLPDVTTGRE